MSIRLLNFTDIDNIRTASNIDEKFLSNYFLNPEEPNYQLYGSSSIKNNSLVGIIISRETPSWFLVKAATCGNIESIFEILGFIIELNEKNNLLQFFTLIDDTEYLKYSLRFSHRYNSYLEYTINNSLTGYENIDRNILQYKIYSQPMKIYCWVLKNEYRTI